MGLALAYVALGVQGEPQGNPHTAGRSLQQLYALLHFGHERAAEADI